MRRLLAILALIAAPALAQEVHSPPIESVITRQIEALKKDDFVGAFAFASPMIRGIFETPERFGRMVVQGYPMVWRPSEVRFLDLNEIEGRLHQTVMVRDAEGRIHILDYEMIESDGGWQINGVQLVRAPSVGA